MRTIGYSAAAAILILTRVHSLCWRRSVWDDDYRYGSTYCALR